MNHQPLQPDKRLKPGDRVLFNPPPAAYSSQCRQAQFAGEKGVVMAMHSEEYGIMLFQKGTCLCNLKYCEKL